MNELTLSWHPPKPDSFEIVRDTVAGYMDYEARFVLFENGTALMLKPELDQQEVISGAMSELRFKTDFKVMPMKDGNFLVWLASPVCVFISAVEAASYIEALRGNPSVAMFPGESFFASPRHPDDYLIGLAGRAKGHLDSRSQVQVARYVPKET